MSKLEPIWGFFTEIKFGHIFTYIKDHGGGVAATPLLTTYFNFFHTGRGTKLLQIIEEVKNENIGCEGV